MKIAIVGSRDFINIQKIRDYIYKLNKDDIVVSGGARGVDTIAIKEAIKCGLETKVFPADWITYGKRAGFIRNEQIVQYSDKVVVFLDRKSKGTTHDITLTKKYRKQLEIYYDNKN